MSSIVERFIKKPRGKIKAKICRPCGHFMEYEPGVGWGCSQCEPPHLGKAAKLGWSGK